MGHADIGSYFPDRPPTWAELLGTALIGGIAVFEYLRDGSIASWPAFWAGFAVTSAFVLISNTTTGKRADAWLVNLGLGGKAMILALLAVAIAVPPNVIVDGFIAGGLIAIVSYYLAHAARAREVSGWWASKM